MSETRATVIFVHTHTQIFLHVINSLKNFTKGRRKKDLFFVYVEAFETTDVVNLSYYARACFINISTYMINIHRQVISLQIK